MKVLDSDKDSKVTASEIDAFLKVSGKPLTQNAVQAIIKVLDSNGDKVIDQK
jgi:Ca2+-binding EF-hand superfamily protein